MQSDIMVAYYMFDCNKNASANAGLCLLAEGRATGGTKQGADRHCCRSPQSTAKGIHLADHRGSQIH